MTWDWLFSPTDNINLVIEVACGIAFTAWVAGLRSKRALVRYLESDESKPVVNKIADVVVAKVPVPKIPQVPTVAEIIAEIPPYPDLSDRLSLMEEKMGTRLTEALEAKWATLGDSLSTRVGQVVQANIANAKSVFARGMKEIEDDLGDGDGSFMMEAAGMFFDEDSVKKLAKARKLWKRMQQGGGNPLARMGGSGNGSPQGGYPFGTIMNGYVATPSGWVPIAQRTAPAPLPRPAPAAGAAVQATPPEAIDLPPELPPEPKK